MFHVTSVLTGIRRTDVHTSSCLKHIQWMFSSEGEHSCALPSPITALHSYRGQRWSLTNDLFWWCLSRGVYTRFYGRRMGGSGGGHHRPDISGQFDWIWGMGSRRMLWMPALGTTSSRRRTPRPSGLRNIYVSSDNLEWRWHQILANHPDATSYAMLPTNTHWYATSCRHSQSFRPQLSTAATSSTRLAKSAARCVPIVLSRWTETPKTLHVNKVSSDRLRLKCGLAAGRQAGVSQSCADSCSPGSDVRQAGPLVATEPPAGVIYRGMKRNIARCGTAFVPLGPNQTWRVRRRYNLARRSLDTHEGSKRVDPAANYRYFV